MSTTAETKIASSNEGLNKYSPLVVAGGALLLASPYMLELISAGLQWLGGNESYKAFTEGESLRNTNVGFNLVFAALMMLAGCLMQITRVLMPNSGIATRGLQTLTGWIVTLFATGYLIFQSFFISTGEHLGLMGLSIHSGSAYCIVAYFVVYRFFESRSKGDALYEEMFRNQLFVLAVGPFMFQVAYGIWFALLGHGADGTYTQQLIITFGYYLLPLLGIYSYSTLLKSESGNTGFIIAVVCLALIVLGTFGYAGSSVQPAVL